MHPRTPPDPIAPHSGDPLAEVACAAVAGDRRAIQQLVRATGPSVLRVVRQILGVYHPDVDDVTQEATFAAIEALGNFRGECTVLHFVWRVAVLTAMNARRRAQIRQRVNADATDVDTQPSDAPSPMGSAMAARRREAVRQLLDELPPAQSEVLSLHCVLGYTIEETAKASGVPANTVRSRLITAKAALRERLLKNAELCDLIRGAS